MIHFLPSRTGPRVEARLIPATEALCLSWDATIQPAIDNSKPRRADFGWRWSSESFRLATVANVHSFAGFIPFAAFFASVLRQQPITLALVGRGRNDEAITLALALLCDVFEFSDRYCQFLWFFSTAPASTFASSFTHQPGQIGRGTIFALVRRTLTLNHRGDTVLHAAPHGGRVLLDWYQGVGMRPVASDVPISPGRYNDGRYLSFTNLQAQAFVESNMEVFL